MELLLFLGLLVVGLAVSALGYYERNMPMLAIAGGLFFLLGVFVVAEGFQYTTGSVISLNQTNDSTTTYINQSETFVKTTYQGTYTSTPFGIILWLIGLALMARGVVTTLKWWEGKKGEAESEA